MGTPWRAVVPSDLSQLGYLCRAHVAQTRYRTLKHTLVQQDIVQADETTLTVLHETGRRPSKNLMWLYRTGERVPRLCSRVSAGTAGSLCATISDGISGLLAM
ncbi:IS66 family transposase [Sulfobacillus thermosulfidooxidans]|uniref:IS66 family transposase n=1 Tax=Sulfobacillus thermosulfidooxidans TaxID=28034 RepID=UPI003BF9B942